jgi:isopentenyl-diphosphate delta-isomerase
MKVVLVNEHDQAIGEIEKMAAHEQGLLHRAFSVFLMNDQHQILMQQRAFDKYHSGGLWTNTCCSHPQPHETIKEAAERRLLEELDIIATVSPFYEFVYRHEFENGLIEHEYDHVLTGYYNGVCTANPEEVAGVQWMSVSAIDTALEAYPEKYTYWFKLAYPAIREWILM